MFARTTIYKSLLTFFFPFLFFFFVFLFFHFHFGDNNEWGRYPFTSLFSFRVINIEIGSFCCLVNLHILFVISNVSQNMITFSWYVCSVADFLRFVFFFHFRHLDARAHFLISTDGKSTSEEKVNTEKKERNRHGIYSMVYIQTVYILLMAVVESHESNIMKKVFKLISIDSKSRAIIHNENIDIFNFAPDVSRKVLSTNPPYPIAPLIIRFVNVLCFSIFYLKSFNCN